MYGLIYLLSNEWRCDSPLGTVANAKQLNSYANVEGFDAPANIRANTIPNTNILICMDKMLYMLDV